MIEARGVHYSIGPKTLLEDVTVAIAPGEIVALVGPNGAGKSTLRKILTGDLTPSSGEVWMGGQPLTDWPNLERARVRAVLPQDATLSFPFTVNEVVLMGRTPHLRGAESLHDHEIAADALQAVEADHLRERLYTTLSGGERQRVHLARVLAQIWENAAGQTRYLLLDEPTASLDLAHQHSALRVVRRFAREGVAAFVILHDLNLAAQYADRIVILKSGGVVIAGTPDEVLTESAVRQTFDLPVTIVRHPHANRPVVISE